MRQPSFYIDEPAFQLLKGPGFWQVQDLSPDRAEQIRPFLNNADTLAVFASGISPDANASLPLRSLCPDDRRRRAEGEPSAYSTDEASTCRGDWQRGLVVPGVAR
jgi:hypothetical protein